MQRDDRIFAAVGGCVILAATVIGGVHWLGSGIIVEAPERASVKVERLPAPIPAASPASRTTALDSGAAADEGDRLVRLAVAQISSHPVLASWLVNDRLLKRFVASVDAIAGGFSPRDEIEFMRPVQPFMVQRDSGLLLITNSSYRRYDRVAEVVDSIDPAGAVALYRKLGPKLEEIYAEVAWASSDFDSRFREAVDHLLEVEVPESPLEVEQRAIAYAFAEDRLEHLSGAQRQLLRMGSYNALKVQDKLRGLRQALGWPEPAPAVMTVKPEVALPLVEPVLTASLEGGSAEPGPELVGAATAP
ncbi:MAG: DUF3014 domain-containing protein [Thermoanaerobaculales bacterium]